MASVLNKLTGFVFRTAETEIQFQQKAFMHHSFVDWRMLKDYNKRKTLERYGKERLRINALRKNKILPPELQAIADEEIAELPRDSSIVAIRNRCLVTSRPKGFITQFRVSRIVFRHLADYNKLAGVKRAMW